MWNRFWNKWATKCLPHFSLLLLGVGGGAAAPAADALLLETGDYILLETGDRILME